MRCKNASLGLSVYKVHFLKPCTSIIIYLVFPLNELYKIAARAKAQITSTDPDWASQLPRKMTILISFSNSTTRIPWEACGNTDCFHHPRIFRFIELGWLLGICISHKFLDMADDAAGLGTSLWRPLTYSTLSWWLLTPHLCPKTILPPVAPQVCWPLL